jgi:hypothetical protein
MHLDLVNACLSKFPEPTSQQFNCIADAEANAALSSSCQWFQNNCFGDDFWALVGGCGPEPPKDPPSPKESFFKKLINKVKDALPFPLW